MTVFHPSPDHSIWLRSQAAVFVYLPKVACTSWKLHLAAALGVQAHQEISYKRCTTLKRCRCPMWRVCLSRSGSSSTASSSRPTSAISR